MPGAHSSPHNLPTRRAYYHFDDVLFAPRGTDFLTKACNVAIVHRIGNEPHKALGNEAYNLPYAPDFLAVCRADRSCRIN